MAKLGVVAIGRNEGERLRRCLESVGNRAEAVVYVDSGSTDGSVELAHSRGVQTLALDLSIPFTAARARNEGLQRLLQVCPVAEFVQFIDGDCELAADWLERAVQELKARPEVAVVCGRRRERFPEATIYNLLCDLEWDTPVGAAESCGGDALIRVGPFQQVGGFRASLIAGEEPELCLRLRCAGWKIVRVAAEMTLHDAAMTRFRQWWRRAVRAGHAFAECSWLHRSGPLRMWRRETRSNWFWGLILPVAALVPAWLTHGLSVVLLLAYLVLAVRVYRGRRRRGDSARVSRQYAFFCVLAKFAHVMGQLRFHRGRLLSRPSVLIEYKQAADSKSPPG